MAVSESRASVVPRFARILSVLQHQLRKRVSGVSNPMTGNHCGAQISACDHESIVFRDIAIPLTVGLKLKLRREVAIELLNGFFSVPSNVECRMSSDGRRRWVRMFWLWLTRLRKFWLRLVRHSAKLVEVSSIDMKLPPSFESFNVSPNGRRESGWSPCYSRFTMYVARVIMKHESVVLNQWTDRCFPRYSYSAFSNSQRWIFFNRLVKHFTLVTIGDRNNSSRSKVYDVCEIRECRVERL